jgi:hypothetical protein
LGTKLHHHQVTEETKKPWKILNLFFLVSLIVAAAAECHFSSGRGNALSTDNGAPSPLDSGTPAAPPMTTEPLAAAQ